MKTISKQSENMGGIVNLWAIPPSDYSISGKTMTIPDNSNIVEIYIQEDSGSFTEEDITASAFKTEITAQVPCDNSTSQGIILQLERIRKYNVIFQDGNGNFKLAGTKQIPLRFFSKQITGATTASLNHYAISFLAKAITCRAIFINNPF